MSWKAISGSAQDAAVRLNENVIMSMKTAWECCFFYFRNFYKSVTARKDNDIMVISK
jgi:hypothetical protein